METANALTQLWAAPEGRSARLDELAERRVEDVPLDAISPNPHQPRGEIDVDSADFAELVASIRAQGLLQPVVVWQPVPGERRYVLVAGERRWRAMRVLAGEDGSGRVPAVVIRLGDAPEADLLGRALTENVVRTDLSTAETAQAVARLRELTGWTWEVIARRLGLSVNRVQDLAAVARHDPVRLAVAEGVITQRQAVAIGQGAADAAAAAELVEQARGRDLAGTRRLVAARRGRDLRVPADPVITPPPLVDAGSLPIAALVGRGPVARDEVERALAASCAVLGYWPAKP